MGDYMKTALVRLNGSLQIIRNNYYFTNKEMETELKSNGYKVLKVWNGNKSDSFVDNWEWLNRK